MALHRKAESVRGKDEIDVNPVYVQLARQEVPRYRMPPSGMLPDTALQVVRDELILDGSSRLNLATFVTTWMEPQAAQLMAECFDKNMIDKDEYPQTSELERRCVSILADLWHAPAGGGAPGCSTTGSSEACMLGGMALLWRWRARHAATAQGQSQGGAQDQTQGGAQDQTRGTAQDKAQGDKPNLVMGTNVQVCWEKFCRYWQVEPRMVPMERDRLHLRGPQAAAACDENTIGVVGIMGSTMDGSYEPVAEISEALDRLQAERDLDIPIHVDGASGGFVAPFLHPELPWDFRVPRVQSINASGHKYGLVYPGVGWIVWREAAALPDDLVFRVNYLGGNMLTFALNFSRPGGHVAAQYYNFLRLGFEGYQRIGRTCQDVALRMSAEIAAMGPFELLTDGSDLPVFAFKLADDSAGYSVFDLSERLRLRGWLVPAYTFPANLQDVAVLRIVVRNGFSHDLAGLLLDDLRRHSTALRRHPHPNLPLVPRSTRQTFAH